MGQFMDCQRVAVLIHIAVYFVPVILKIVGRLQLDALLTAHNGIHQICHNGTPRFSRLVQKLHQLPQLVPHILKQQNISGLPKRVRLDFLNDRQFLFNLWNADFPLQARRYITQLSYAKIRQVTKKELGAASKFLFPRNST